MRGSRYSLLSIAFFFVLASLFMTLPAMAQGDGEKDGVSKLREDFEKWRREMNAEMEELRRENKDLRDKIENLSSGDGDGISPSMEKKLVEWLQKNRARKSLLEVKGADGSFVTNIRFFGGIRERLEFVDNLTDFNTSRDDKKSFVDSRIRLGVALEFQDWVDVLIELQNNSYFGDSSTEFGPNARNDNEDDIEVYQAYITFHDFFGTDAEVRIGRQEIVKGRQFLVGNDDFYSGLSFDAFRVMYEISSIKLEIDAWWARLSDNYADATGDDRYSGDERDFFGLYLTWKGVHDKVGMIDAIEAYILYVRDQTDNPYEASVARTNLGPDSLDPFYVNDFVNEDRYTVGTRIYGRFIDNDVRLLKYNFEFAFQFGDAGSAGPFDATTGLEEGGSGMSGGEIKAFGLEAELFYQIRKWRLKPVFILSYSYATGDSNPEDEDQGTFNPLFQNSHNRLGLADLFQTENIHSVGLTGMIYPSSRLEIGGSLYYFLLDSTRDYAAPSSVAPLMGGSAEVGGGLAWEFDLFANFQYSERLMLQIVYSRVMMGDAVHDNLRALRSNGSNDSVNRFYINIVFKF